MNKDSKLFADVAIIAKALPRKKNVYTYICDTSFSLGDLVEIPFGKKTAQGIILSFHKTSLAKYAYKKITRKIQSPAITPFQHQLALFLSREYVTPFGSVVRLFFPPKKPKREIPTIPSHREEPKQEIPENISKECVEIFTHLEKHQNALLQEPSGEHRLQKVFALAKEKTKGVSQALIIFPDKNTLFWAHKKARSYWEENSLSLLYGGLSSSQKYSNWKKIQSHHTLVLGTKSALFAPYKNLDLIIIEDEHRSAHKQREIAPRYDTRRVALELAKIHQCPVIMTSATPSIEYAHCRKTSSWKILSPKKSFQKKQTPCIVNMKLEMYKNKRKYSFKGRSFIFSEILLETIKQTLKDKNPFFLFVSRRGMHTLSFCSDCKKVLLCPKCQHILSEQNNETYACLSCGFISKTFMECPHCHGMQFTHKNTGTQAIEKTLKTLFPYTRIVRVDADTLESKVKKKEVFQEKLEKADIVVGTPALAYLPFLRKLGGIGIIEAESFLQWSEYLAEEQAFQFFTHVANLSHSETKKSTPFIIQTYNENHRVVRALSHRKEEIIFAKEILEERKEFLYPPFSKMILLSGSYKTEKKANKEAEDLYTILKKSLSPNTSVSPPFSSMRKKKDALFRKNIVIKIPKKWNSPLDNKVYGILLSLPAHWIIDIDPKEIL